VIFDESNGSQVEQVDSSVVGKEDPPCEAIKQMTIGNIRPQEDQATDEEDPQAIAASISADILHKKGQHSPTVIQQGGSVAPSTSAAASPTTTPQVQGLNLEPIFEQEEAEGLKEEEGGIEHPRLRQTIQWDHPIDNIIGSIRRGVTTHSHLANFYQYYSFVSSLEPLKVKQALGDPDWVIAMQEELNNFKRNQVWILVERPNTNVIGTKWVFRNKQDENGVVTRNKARLVAQGFTQVEGLDFEETYAPVARLEAIRMLLAFAAHHDFKLYQVDVKSAFLDDPIQELVFVEQPLGFEDPKFPNHV
jgi:hypothetical protein